MSRHFATLVCAAALLLSSGLASADGFDIEATILGCAADYCAAPGAKPAGPTADDLLSAVRSALKAAGQPEPENLREIISLHIGQAGCQLSEAAPPPAPTRTETTRQPARR